mmetsp:Transcript_12713/g.14829  ORF Transcript_12713/g.14829 Transcript_12713/m.14829 type:complete len:84 (+) Transcript_12713:360-611(+)
MCTVVAYQVPNPPQFTPLWPLCTGKDTMLMLALAKGPEEVMLFLLLFLVFIVVVLLFVEHKCWKLIVSWQTVEGFGDWIHWTP